MRTLMRRVHLWLGLSLGPLLVLEGVTGGILVFYPELDRALVPALARVPETARPASWQAVYDALRRDHPDRPGAWRIEVTPGGGAIPVRYYAPVETRGQRFAPLMLWLDPRSLATIRAGRWGEYPTTWIYALHWQLLAGERGEAVMAVAGVAMLALLVSGLVAWWPRAGQGMRAIRFKRRAAPVRRLYDLHKLIALGALPVLAVVVATGVLLELPDTVRPAVARVSPLFATPAFTSRPAGRRPLPLDRLVATARARFPDAALAWIETPADAAGVVRVNLACSPEPSRRFPRTNVWLDPYDGRVLAVRDGTRDAPGDVFLNWLHPLHAGEAFGMAGRVAVLLSGVAAFLLAFTGWLRWAIRRPG